MKILFLTQVLPYPLDAGPKMRAYYTLRHLGQRHEITLLSFVRDSDSPEALEHLRSAIPCRVPQGFAGAIELDKRGIVEAQRVVGRSLLKLSARRRAR